jgi:transcriptional regulator with XRE-family HTH domain
MEAMKKSRRKEDNGSRAPTNVDEQVGRNIRSLRNERGLTIAELGASIGVSPQQVQKYEVGQSRVSASKIVEIVDALGVTIDDLFSNTKRLQRKKRGAVEAAREQCRSWINRTRSRKKLMQMARVLKAMSDS